MTTKTLGQIAYEAAMKRKAGGGGHWNGLHPEVRAEWEAAADAVRDECAQAAYDAGALEGIGKHALSSIWDAIRARGK